MLAYFTCDIEMGAQALRRPQARYDLLERMAACARARDVDVLAFGLGERTLRVVLEGDAVECVNVLRGTKGGTVRAARGQGVTMLWSDTVVTELTEVDLLDAVVACHLVPPCTDPLDSPWTSHRDLLGYRRADFFDAALAWGRVDPRDVHARAGGAPLPASFTPTLEPNLDRLLRVSAAVVGVPPAHRRSFRLFVHLGRLRGFGTHVLADALMLTGRRVRQLAASDEPLVSVALAHLADQRLAQVP